jgi:hypothetical protein
VVVSNDVSAASGPTATGLSDQWSFAVLTGAFAVLVAASSFVILLTGRRHALAHLNVLGTITHEAGHAAISVLTGGGVYRFQITSPDAGSVHAWWPSRLSSVAGSLAGYAAPPLAGLAAAALLHRGHASAVLTLTVVMMALLLFVSRDAITFGCVLLAGFLAFATVRWGPLWLQDYVAYTESWLLLTSEISGLAYLTIAHFCGFADGTDDADDLARETHIPSFVWILGWFVLIGWSLVKAVPLMWT